MNQGIFMLRSIFDATTNIPTIIQFFDDMFRNHNEFENVFHPQSTIDPSLNTFSSSTGLLQSFFKAIKNNVQIGQQFLNLLQIPSSDEKYVVIFLWLFYIDRQCYISIFLILALDLSD